MTDARVRIEGGETGMSTRVLVDGKPLRVRRMVVTFESSSYTTAEIDLYPDDVAALVVGEHVAVTCAICGDHHECGVPSPDAPPHGGEVRCRCPGGIGSHQHGPAEAPA